MRRRLRRRQQCVVQEQNKFHPTSIADKVGLIRKMHERSTNNDWSYEERPGNSRRAEAEHGNKFTIGTFDLRGVRERVLPPDEAQGAGGLPQPKQYREGKQTKKTWPTRDSLPGLVTAPRFG